VEVVQLLNDRGTDQLLKSTTFKPIIPYNATPQSMPTSSDYLTNLAPLFSLTSYLGHSGAQKQYIITSSTDTGVTWPIKKTVYLCRGPSRFDAVLAAGEKLIHQGMSSSLDSLFQVASGSHKSNVDTRWPAVDVTSHRHPRFGQRLRVAMATDYGKPGQREFAAGMQRFSTSKAQRVNR